MAILTSAKRKKLATSQFAGPDRSYPINDANHARAALSMSAKYASPEEKSTIRAKVKRKFPGIK